MNNLLQLKGTFEQASSNTTPGAPNLPVNKLIEVSKLEKLRNDLIKLKQFWLNEIIFNGALISVYYNKVAAKSNRIQGLLTKGSISANSSIVGARFTDDDSPRHIITHYVSMEIIDESINRLGLCIELMNNEFDGSISHETIEKINLKEQPFSSKSIAKTNFLKIVVDAYYLEKFDVFVDTMNLKEESIITIFKTEVKAIKLMERIGINLQFTRVLDDTTILLRQIGRASCREKV